MREAPGEVAAAGEAVEVAERGGVLLGEEEERGVRGKEVLLGRGREQPPLPADAREHGVVGDGEFLGDKVQHEVGYIWPWPPHLIL